MIRSVEMVEVVKIEHTVGKGTKDDPVRLVCDYWSKDGVLIASFDRSQ